jgi:hypothetical protein
VPNCNNNLNLPGYHYKVNDKIFLSKIEAILEAQKTSADVSWYFYNHVFDSVDWTKEPDLSLDAFYKIRAQQIRDQFDYVIVLASGGADSTNALWSFLKNNIHVDEIIAGAPMSGLKNYTMNNSDRSVNNTISETEYALWPLLDEVKQNYPNVKITINDYFEDILNYKTDEWLYRAGEWISPVTTKGNLDKFSRLVDMAENGKKIGVVWGIDKPNIRYLKDGSVCLNILDRAVNIARPSFAKSYPNVETVLFYYTAQLPELMIKQAHTVAKYINLPENRWISSLVLDLSRSTSLETSLEYDDLGLPGAVTTNLKGDYQRSIVPCIYPTHYSQDIFQCAKSNGTFMGLQNSWFYSLHKDTRAYQLIKSDFSMFYKNLKSKYLAPSRREFKFYKLSYKIVHISNFKENI